MQVITANAFGTGEVVYHADDGWVDDLQLARIFADDAVSADAIAAVMAQAQPHQVVGVYAIAVDAHFKRITPVQYREVIRASGPTNYRHGKHDEGVRGHVSL